MVLQRRFTLLAALTTLAAVSVLPSSVDGAVVPVDYKEQASTSTADHSTHIHSSTHTDSTGHARPTNAAYGNAQRQQQPTLSLPSSMSGSPKKAGAKGDKNAGDDSDEREMWDQSEYSPSWLANHDDSMSVMHSKRHDLDRNPHRGKVIHHGDHGDVHMHRRTLHSRIHARVPDIPPSVYVSDNNGSPYMVAYTKRDGQQTNGVPGSIDIMSDNPSSANALKIASLVLSTPSNATATGNSTASSFVLNASGSDHTQMYLIATPGAANSTSSGNSTSAGNSTSSDLSFIQVALQIPVFNAETAQMDPYCATFDPNPPAPSPLTVEVCMGNYTTGGNHKSQLFAFEPATGVIRPMWSSNSSDPSLDPGPDNSTATSSSAGSGFSSTATDSPSSAAPSSTNVVQDVVKGLQNDWTEATTPPWRASSAKAFDASSVSQARNVTLVFTPAAPMVAPAAGTGPIKAVASPGANVSGDGTGDSSGGNSSASEDNDSNDSADDSNDDSDDSDDSGADGSVSASVSAASSTTASGSSVAVSATTASSTFAAAGTSDSASSTATSSTSMFTGVAAKIASAFASMSAGTPSASTTSVIETDTATYASTSTLTGTMAAITDSASTTATDSATMSTATDSTTPAIDLMTPATDSTSTVTDSMTTATDVTSTTAVSGSATMSSATATDPNPSLAVEVYDPESTATTSASESTSLSATDSSLSSVPTASSSVTALGTDSVSSVTSSSSAASGTDSSSSLMPTSSTSIVARQASGTNSMGTASASFPGFVGRFREGTVVPSAV